MWDPVRLHVAESLLGPFIVTWIPTLGLACLNVTFCFIWLILPVTFRFVQPLLHYPSVTVTSVSFFFTQNLPPVQVPTFIMPFPVCWVTLADLSHRDNYQRISLLYPNLTYSSKTRLTPALSCHLSHSCRYPSVTITNLSAFFTLTLPTVHCPNLPLPFPADWAPASPSRVATSPSPRPATSRMMAVSSWSPLSPGANTRPTLA